MGRKPKGSAPNNAAGGLTPAQERVLAVHLCKQMDPADAARVFYAVEHWFGFVPRSATPAARSEATAQHQLYAGIVTMARGLQDAILGPYSVWTKAGFAPGLMGQLEQLAVSAERLSRGPERATKGRPPVEWRDGLVALLDAHYPRTARPRRATISLILGFLGEHPADVKSVIKRARGRETAPPFVLGLEEPGAGEVRPHLPWSSKHGA